MKTNFKALFYFKGLRNYDAGPVPVYKWITVVGLRVETTTEKDCEPAYWNPSAGRMKGTKENVRTFNNYLDNLIAQLDDAHVRLPKPKKILRPKV